MQNILRLYFLLLLITISQASYFDSAFANNSSSLKPFVDIKVDHPRYGVGQIVNISGSLYNDNGTLSNGKVTIQIKCTNNLTSTKIMDPFDIIENITSSILNTISSPCTTADTYPNKSVYVQNGKFSITFPNTEEYGKYTVDALMIILQ